MNAKTKGRKPQAGTLANMILPRIDPRIRLSYRRRHIGDLKIRRYLDWVATRIVIEKSIANADYKSADQCARKLRNVLVDLSELTRNPSIFSVLGRLRLTEVDEISTFLKDAIKIDQIYTNALIFFQGQRAYKEVSDPIHFFRDR